MRVAGALFLTLLFWCASAGASNTTAPLNNAQKLDLIIGAIQEKLDIMSTDLQQTAAGLAKTGLASAEARRLLAELCQKHPSVVDCSTIDTSGRMVAVEPPAYQHVEGSDISSQAQVVKVLQTKKPVFSRPFKAVEGFHVMDMEWPVLSAKGQLLGSVSVIARPFVVMDAIIKPQLSRDTSDVWVLDTEGQIIYSRYRKNLGDNPLATPSLVGGGTLDDLVVQITAEPSGTGHFSSAPVGNQPPRITRCMWKTIPILDTHLRVVVFGNDRAN